MLTNELTKSPTEYQNASSALEVVFSTTQYHAKLRVVADELRASSATAANEATVAFTFDHKLYSLVSDMGGVISFEKEVIANGTVRKKAKGRIDSKVGDLIIEYKHHKKMNNDKKRKAALEQGISYFSSLEAGKESLLAVTDGLQIALVIRLADGKLDVTEFQQLSNNHIDVLLRWILQTEKKVFGPKSLVDDLSHSGLVKNLTHTLYAQLNSVHIISKTEMLYSEWKALFKLAHDDKSKQKAIHERRVALANAFGFSNFAVLEDEYKALYALQTGYSIIVKLFAYKVLFGTRFGAGNIFAKLIDANQDLNLFMSRMESGHLFRQEGFSNLIEFDFFSWYSVKDQWNPSINKAIAEIITAMDPYESCLTLTSNVNVQDLFKDLYMSILPEKVRHSLGEFYTPAWLADHTVDVAIESAQKTDWRGVDPCCGSGTFVTTMIRKVLSATAGEARDVQLTAVLSRCVGFDLNPLAVLAAKVNYFINISHLLPYDEMGVRIPIYLGDASYVPETCYLGPVKCFTYAISTLKGPLEITIPQDALRNHDQFLNVIADVEAAIHREHVSDTNKGFCSLCPTESLTSEVLENLLSLSTRLVDLQKLDWNGIWPRIVTNFLMTASLERFDVIVGNPPWVDWKNLPAGYRDRIKGLCLNRGLFSGDKLTGGINLNICALITNVVCSQWLASEGVLAFLMPEPLLFQQSYEGFRRLNTASGPAYLQKIYNWTKAGDPFKPVTQKFCTYIISNKTIEYQNGIEVVCYKSKRGKTAALVAEMAKNGKSSDGFSSFISAAYDVSSKFAFTAHKNRTAFTYADKESIDELRKVAGTSYYLGREGIEFYPQELVIFQTFTKKASNPKHIWVKNFQGKKSKHRVTSEPQLLEREFLKPLIKSIDIERFCVKDSRLLASFPYLNGSRSSMSQDQITQRAPKLFSYFLDNKKMFENQSDHNDKIIGGSNNNFYSLARVGDYTYADHFVCFRDNTKWVSAVVSKVASPWGEYVRPVFQNHAVTITQRPDGTYISECEAHYICAILNAPIVKSIIMQSSDSRSFKIRPQVHVPVFNVSDANHIELSNLSIAAHRLLRETPRASLQDIDTAIDRVYIDICSQR